MITLRRKSRQREIIYSVICKSAEQKKVLFENTARNMNGVPKEILIRHIKNRIKADKVYGEGVQAELNNLMSAVK